LPPLLARRDLEAALAAAEEAAAASEVVGPPLERGGPLVVAGGAVRRLGERGSAARKLDAAKLVFGELGAPLWVARAEKELHRARSAGLATLSRRVLSGAWSPLVAAC